jgi:hypothetical protein
MSERQVLINLIASLSLADHMGDAYEDCEQALKQIGIDVPSILDSPLENPEYWEHLAHFLSHHHNAETVWGTSLLEEDA